MLDMMLKPSCHIAKKTMEKLIFKLGHSQNSNKLSKVFSEIKLKKLLHNNNLIMKSFMNIKNNKKQNKINKKLLPNQYNKKYKWFLVKLIGEFLGLLLLKKMKLQSIKTMLSKILTQQAWAHHQNLNYKISLLLQINKKMK